MLLEVENLYVAQAVYLCITVLSDDCHKQHQRIGLYNGHELCPLRGRN
jgi:hypothetical protein